MVRVTCRGRPRGEQRFIAGDFNVARVARAQPAYARMKPEQRGQKVQEDEKEPIVALRMRQFVTQDYAEPVLRPFMCAQREHDGGTQPASREGYRDLRTAAQRDRARIVELAGHVIKQ